MNCSRAPAAQRFHVHHAVEYGAWSGLIVNLVLIALFWLTGLHSLALFSVGSAGLFLYCLRLVKRRRVGLAASLTFAEIIVHVSVVAYMLGADAGFQYYLLSVTPLIFVGAPQFPLISSCLAGLFGATFIGLDLMTRVTSPPLSLDPEVLGYVRYTNILAAFGMTSYVAWRFGRRMHFNERSLATAANTDPLTTLSNRRWAIRHIEREMSRSDRSGAPVALALADIDRFKTINDDHGHDVGDQVIVSVADRLGETLRGSDLVARWGGEEFLMIMPGNTADAGAEAAERIRRAVADVPVSTSSGEVAVTLTLGVAQRLPGESLSAWLKRADEALYVAKRAGRNRVGVCAAAGRTAESGQAP